MTTSTLKTAGLLYFYKFKIALTFNEQMFGCKVND